MAEIDASPHHIGGQSFSSNTSADTVEEEEEEAYWIHWKDPYWKTVDATPHPDSTTLMAGGGPNETGGNLLSANRDLAIYFVPLLVVLAVGLLVTIVGNAFVCYIYRTRFRRNTASLFVVFLAGLEIVFTCFGVSMETAVLALPLMFDSGVACKIVRYGESAFVYVVLLALTAVSVDRYGKLNRPTNFLPLKWAKRLCIVAVLLGLCLALPAPILFGARVVPTDIPGVTGVTCGVEDAMTSSPVRLVYIVSLTFTFFSTVSAMTVLYVLVLIRLCRRKSTARGERVSPTRRGFPQTHRFVTEDSVSSYGGEDTRPLPTRQGKTSPSLDPVRVPLKAGAKESTRIGQRTNATLDVHSAQMTKIFIMVTLVTVLSITPFVVYRTLQAMSDDLENMQMLGAVVMYQVCVHLYLLHPPVIPIIYLCCNFSFRREARHLLQKVGQSCVRSPQPSPTNSR